MSDFQQLEDLPLPGYFDLDAYVDRQGLLTGLSLTGSYFYGSKEGNLSNLHLHIFHSLLTFTWNFNSIGFCTFSNCGVQSSSRLLLFSNKVVRVIVRVEPLSLSGLSINNQLILSGSFTSAAPDPDDAEDYIDIKKKQDLGRQANITRLKILNEQIEQLSKELRELESNNDTRKLFQLKSSIKVIYDLVLPNGGVSDTFAQVEAIRNFEPKNFNLLPALNGILVSDFVDEKLALDALKKKLNDLRATAKKSEDARLSYQSFLNRWQALRVERMPGSRAASTIRLSEMDMLRDQIANLFGSCPDFECELEVVGFLFDKLDEIKQQYNQALEARKLKDPYQDVKKRVLVETLEVRSKISIFKCNLSDLEKELKGLETKYNQAEAKRRYDNSPAMKGKVIYNAGCC